MQIVNHVGSAAGPAPPPIDPGSNDPPRRKIGWFLVAMLALAIIGAVLIGVGGGRHRTAPPAPSAPHPAVTTPAPTNGPIDRSQTVPTTPPVGIDWRLFAGVVLPYSRIAGPVHDAGAIASGYARTPLGALLAAQQISARYLTSPDGGWRVVTLAQVLPGPGRDRWLQLRAQTNDDPPPDGYGQSAGFRFVTYSRDTAVIQAASRFSDGTMSVTTLTVRWSQGDWRLELQPDGGASPSAQQITALTGFVTFSGV